MEKKIDLGLPDKLKLFDHVSHIEIVRKWLGWQIVFLTAVVLFWDGCLFIWYSKASESENPILIYFPLIHVAVGIGLTYYVIAGWLNRTYIIVSHGKIAVHHRPVPWLGNKELDTSNLRQVYAKEKASHNSNGAYVASYEVHAITHNGQNIKLVSGLATSEQALYIEQKIEKYLSIEDIPVKGGIGT